MDVVSLFDVVYRVLYSFGRVLVQVLSCSYVLVTEVGLSAIMSSIRLFLIRG